MSHDFNFASFNPTTKLGRRYLTNLVSALAAQGHGKALANHIKLVRQTAAAQNNAAPSRIGDGMAASILGALVHRPGTRQPVIDAHQDVMGRPVRQTRERNRHYDPGSMSRVAGYVTRSVLGAGFPISSWYSTPGDALEVDTADYRQIGTLSNLENAVEHLTAEGIFDARPVTFTYADSVWTADTSAESGPSLGYKVIASNPALTWASSPMAFSATGYRNRSNGTVDRTFGVTVVKPTFNLYACHALGQRSDGMPDGLIQSSVTRLVTASITLTGLDSAVSPTWRVSAKRITVGTTYVDALLALVRSRGRGMRRG